ncbi:MAG: hypothetical protein GWM90_15050, partial [Gemmatimonadetes bacterium]|nr:hypothetical protein [Gemmatimonadota bacterium]NIQ55505.1 hypothetical protein [Gemmatimonadota bacterium]NIU75715.1 hypothetical protein [Gammaproteobacteria bacterium]NIX45372.1 hypothetical protein [Gemmatimonadota bacterium]NIY09657.1 hypothetical protein [Gemmatimonadota bacterium]
MPGERRPLDFDPANALPLAELARDLDRTQERLVAGVRALEGDGPAQDAGQEAAALPLHEVYHA